MSEIKKVGGQYQVTDQDIQAGLTFGKLAKKYHTTAKAIVEANNIRRGANGKYWLADSNGKILTIPASLSYARLHQDESSSKIARFFYPTPFPNASPPTRDSYLSEIDSKTPYDHLMGQTKEVTIYQDGMSIKTYGTVVRVERKPASRICGSFSDPTPCYDYNLVVKVIAGTTGNHFHGDIENNFNWRSLLLPLTLAAATQSLLHQDGTFTKWTTNQKVTNTSVTSVVVTSDQVVRISMD